MGKQTSGERGQVLVMVTLITIPLFGVLGLVTDLGYMHYVKMTAQSAAEAAAQATIVDYHQTIGGAGVTCPNPLCAATPTACDPTITALTATNSIQRGCLYAEAHGFTAAGSVTYQTGVSSVPPTVPGIKPAQYWVTFRAVRQVPQLFSAVLGNMSGTVVARSTAAVIGTADCIYALKPTGTAISVGGTASLTSSCGILDNSSDPCALSTNGTANIQAPEYDIVGNACVSTPLTPAPNIGVAPGTDPLASMPAPVYCTSLTPCHCDQWNMNLPNQSNIDLYPGTYCGGINVGNQTVTFHPNADGSPGVYVMLGGGLSTQSANSHIIGNNVMFYNTYGTTDHGNNYVESYTPININANSTVDLTAPTSGIYTGILFFDDRTAPEASDSYGGGSTAIYQGTIYAPTADITMYGNSTASATPSQNAQYTLVVAWTINLVGTTGFAADYSSLPNNSSPIQQVAVVE